MLRARVHRTNTTILAWFIIIKISTAIRSPVRSYKKKMLPTHALRIHDACAWKSTRSMNGQDEDASRMNGTSSSPDKELELAGSGSRSGSGSVPPTSPTTRAGSPQSTVKPDHHDDVIKDPSSSPTLSCTCIYDGWKILLPQRHSHPSLTVIFSELENGPCNAK
ncbi:hypothetical protein BGW80DRAFT_910435 [Lactifluus volemus]|nr:hypothetical protein BGW80DRAFT_910435 [Lactifluus volemus]